MKFDKETVIVIAICVVAIFAWDPLARHFGWIAAPAAPVAVEAPAAAPSPAPVTTPAETPAAPTPVPVTPAAPAAPAPQLPELPPLALNNSSLELTLAPRTAQITTIRLKDYLNAAKTGEVVLDYHPELQPGAFVISCEQPLTVTGVPVSRRFNDREGLVVRELKRADGAVFTAESRWRLSDTYLTEYRLKLRNPGAAPLTFNQLTLSGGDLQPWASLSGDRVRTDPHRIDYQTVDGEFGDLAADAKDAVFFGALPPVRWAGISNKYFALALRCENGPFQLIRNRLRLPDAAGKPVWVVSIGAELSPVTVPAGGETELVFSYYSGPKIAAELAAFEPDAGRILHLAWGPLNYLARLLLWALVGLKGLCGSYGVSIILLTVIVRLLFWPATAKANASMRKMQKIQKPLQELREKYKDNPQLLNAKMMELYRTEGVNPFGGCLPLLLQIPVFFALYETLEGAVQLRQVSFLWAADLAAPDTIFRIPLGFFDLPVNPLVLAMTGLMVLQQRMTPTAMEPMQQKMMMAMPVIMLIFLYNLPSGLTLYWTVSQIFSIVQLWVQHRRNRDAGGPPGGSHERRKSSNGTGSRQVKEH